MAALGLTLVRSETQSYDQHHDPCLKTRNVNVQSTPILNGKKMHALPSPTRPLLDVSVAVKMGQGQKKTAMNVQVIEDMKMESLEELTLIKKTQFPLSFFVVVAFFSLVRILGARSIIHSHLHFFFEVEISSHTQIPLFYARISPQWLRFPFFVHSDNPFSL